MKKGIILLLALASAAAIKATENKDGETRTATKTVQISESESINILGKNTTLRLETWNRNEVEVVATVTFDGEPNNRMREFLDDFENIVKNNISLSAGSLTIDAELETPNKIQIGSRNAGIVVGYGDDKLRIEYAIKLPGKNRLELRTSYKNLVMTGDYNDVEINAYSSDLRAGKFAKAKLYLKYGDGTIEGIDDGYMESYENDMEFGDVGSFEINDKYSELKFKDIENLEIQGYETDIKADNIVKVKGNLKYGEMEVDGKIGAGTFTLYEFDIKSNAAGSLKFDNSKYSNVKLDKAHELKFMESYEDELDIRYINILYAKSKYGNYEIAELGKSVEINGYEDDLDIQSITSDAEKVSMEGKYLTLDINLGGKSFALNADTKYGNIDFNEDDLDVRKYIKENDKLYIEAGAKSGDSNAFQVWLKGYEIKAEID